MVLLLSSLLFGCGFVVGVESDFAEGSDGCAGAGALSADFASALEPSGCQYRITAVGTDLRLLLDVPAFADALTDGAAAATYTLPDDTVRFTVEQGCDLEVGWCGVEGTPSIFTTYTPTAGTVTVSVTEGASGDLLATVTFDGVTFEDTEGASLAMDPLTWTDVPLHGMDE
jgi:hypothetical protein